MQHPLYSSAWKLVDRLRSKFAAENQNLRLGIAADGINSDSVQSSRYRC